MLGRAEEDLKPLANFMRESLLDFLGLSGSSPPPSTDRGDSSAAGEVKLSAVLGDEFTDEVAAAAADAEAAGAGALLNMPVIVLMKFLLPPPPLLPLLLFECFDGELGRDESTSVVEAEAD